MQFQSNTVNNLNLQYLKQNYIKKNTKRATSENFLVAPHLRLKASSNNNNKSQIPDMDTVTRYLYLKFAKEHEKVKRDRRRRLLKESTLVHTNRLMKEANNEYKLLSVPTYRTFYALKLKNGQNGEPSLTWQNVLNKTLLNMAKRPYNPRNSNKDNNNEYNNNNNSLKNKKMNKHNIMSENAYNNYLVSRIKVKTALQKVLKSVQSSNL
jgi:hypothetical protein